MLTTIAHLPEGEIKLLAQLVQKIVSAVAPDKIICYGSRTNIMQDWSCFLTGEDHQEDISTRFDLLILTHATEKRPDYDIIQLIEQECPPVGTVTCIVHKLSSVNDALAEGSRFFTGLYHKGVLLYDGTGIPLVTPPELPDTSAVISKIKAYWDKEYSLAQHFFNVASHSISSGWSVLAVFLLHQAAEHTCKALIRVFTGYRCNTHNLSRLLALTENFSLLPMSVFPGITYEETELFNLLLKGYSDSRYKDGYHVTIEKATILVARVKELQAVAEHLYQKKINSYANNQGITFPLVVGAMKQ